MSLQRIQLEPNNFYHIYNHSVGGRDLFREPDNYEYFLSLYDKYISSIAETYAWVLMKNHFHLLVRVKKEAEIASVLHLTGFENLSGVKPLHQYFSNLFNAYTKAFNKYYQTNGTLFERPFKRRLIDNNEYLRQVILYIHNNPVHHGFCEHPREYPWSSYLTCLSIKPTKLKRDAVMGWFDSEANFRTMHNEKVEFEKIEEWLGSK
jgi:REP element-mobilizing transposase RayT